jgi:hypothetical protein
MDPRSIFSCTRSIFYFYILYFTPYNLLDILMDPRSIFSCTRSIFHYYILYFTPYNLLDILMDLFVVLVLLLYVIEHNFHDIFHSIKLIDVPQKENNK